MQDDFFSKNMLQVNETLGFFQVKVALKFIYVLSSFSYYNHNI